MKDRPKITKIEVYEFEFQLKDRELRRTAPAPIYKPGSVVSRSASAIRIFTNLGVTGEYVGGSATPIYARLLIGRNALDREAIYNDTKQASPGMSQVNVALWDLAGKFYEAPIHELLGTYRTSLPCYASTLDGDSSPGGLNTPKAYADFAQQCLEMGYRAFKIHPWEDAPIEQHIAAIHAVGKRVGDKMDLMLDPFCSLKTFGDALKVGRACDEERFFWWEDPFKDGGVSAFAHRKLRQMVRTPLLQLEKVRGLEPHVDFIMADGTDFVRGDINDGGITGVMKIAHAAEGFGLDVELHGCGPAQRHLMAAMRNSNYYEMVWVHPRVTNSSMPPVYKNNYRDGLDAIDKNGCVEVPQGPGLGVEYDWDYIAEHSTDVTVYE